MNAAGAAVVVTGVGCVGAERRHHTVRCGYVSSLGGMQRGGGLQ
jgi:hypothetical protein